MNVEILSHFGSDLMVANVAKVSYNKESESMGHKEEKLLKFLAEHKHTTPFRHPQLQFRIECPIFVERQLFTHQIGWARNSISGRYVDFSDTYWYPEKFRYQSKDSKQGSAGELSEQDNAYFSKRYQEVINQAQHLYKEMSEFGIAKELCRVHLPLSLETKFIWTGSFHAFTHLCALRLKPDAQYETRDLVSQMLQAVKDIPENPFKFSLQAFGL
jgi:thymidylate synthase (FAD)